jgi:hypothetical protein
VSDCLKILSIDSEENILDSETIDVARNLSCSTNSLYCCLVASFANLAFEFNVLHCNFVFKMCYSVSGRTGNPIAPKSSAAFYGAAKIDKLFGCQRVCGEKDYLIKIVALFHSSPM